MKLRKTAFVLAITFLFTLSGCKSKPDIFPEAEGDDTTTALVTEGTAYTNGTTVSVGESSGTAQTTAAAAVSPLTGPTADPRTIQTTVTTVETTVETTAPTPPIPIVKSPFAAIEYVDCSYAENCPKDYRCHVENASLRYDPIGKRVICTKHFATALVTADRESNVTGPTQRQYLFHGDEFVLNLKVDEQYATYRFNIRNNTYKKLPYQFRSVNDDLKKGLIELWVYDKKLNANRQETIVYDLETQKEFVLPSTDASGHKMFGYSFPRTGKFVLSQCAERDHLVMVNLESEDIHWLPYGAHWQLFDSERYLRLVVSDGDYRIYDTTTGKEVNPSSAQPENPYIADGCSRQNMITGERTVFPNIHEEKCAAGLVIGDYAYAYQMDGFVYKTEIQTLQQVRFPIPKEIDEVITAAYRDDKIQILCMEVDERTNTLLFLNYSRRPYP